ncbi:SusD/RagB family nutrient-binding outer membrane lipoprotein [Mucilaginibacter pallidiroseus]|uniref:SusD/RagB family nutrient-binding outer membrane lipoprotein n=1 Tax=Mucilaginibacter pallidiroseus TaxID=2599295 RepID=A0A563U3J2_9SPHI|nr:SusD/RagB family nutrient-binding outer membrane lipoprotein [Mucilaginibacter pallidiroseus]TWR25893.1 SusD/RagB family nutrient-binding outer membrane lipoprotein [Mucilaginibacter pallidiroseus]
MKKFTTVILISAAFSVGLLSSCKKIFENPDINTNPNAVTNVDLPTLMGGTMLGVGLLHEDTDVRIASMWAGELNGLARAHLGYAQYIVSAQNFTWSPLYPVAGQARLMQLKADSIGNAWGKGIGQVLEAMVIAKATALYGDVPYSQAFDAARYPTPVFDKQQDVYTALQTTLDNTITNLSASTGSAYPAKDFIYKGDVKKWLAAANTLKARLFLHTGNYAQAVQFAQRGIASPAADALMPHGTAIGVDINQNYDFFAVSRIGDAGFDGAYLPKLMQSRIGSANTKTDETALYNYYFKKGLTATNSLDGNTVDGAFVNNASQPLITYYENQLILAEAQARLGQYNEALNALNSVRTNLNNGIINGRTFGTTGRKYEAYTLADFSPSGQANSTGSGSLQVALLYEIISQRYICFLMQYEAFNDYRRLANAVPVVQLPIPLNTGTQKPQRFIYPQVEINTNPNVPKPLANQFTKLPVFQ